MVEKHWANKVGNTVNVVRADDGRVRRRGISAGSTDSNHKMGRQRMERRAGGGADAKAGGEGR